MNSKRNLVIGGTVLAGSVAALLYLYSRNNEKQTTRSTSTKSISKELVVKILKEVQKDMFSILTNVAMISNQIKEQARGRVTNQELREYLLNQSILPTEFIICLDKQLRDEIKSLTEKILERYELEEQDLKHACEVTYKDDRFLTFFMYE